MNGQLSPMLIADCKPFEWYFVVTCSTCRVPHALFHDPSRGKGRLRETQRNRCETCGATSYYEPDEIDRYQHVVERRRGPRN